MALCRIKGEVEGVPRLRATTRTCAETRPPLCTRPHVTRNYHERRFYATVQKEIPLAATRLRDDAQLDSVYVFYVSRFRDEAKIRRLCG